MNKKNVIIQQNSVSDQSEANFMRIFMGPPVAAKEFDNFELGITFKSLPLSFGKWFVFSQNGVSLHNLSFSKRDRVWRPPTTMEDLLFEIDGNMIAVLYGKELRMKKLLRKLHDLKVSMILGYLELDHYNSHMLIANGWGASQVVNVPTLLVSSLNNEVGYSFFTKESGLKNGVNFLYELYSFVEFSSTHDNSNKNKSKHNNNGIKGDR